MAEKKPNYIPFFFDDVDALDELGDAERGRLLTALLKYGEQGATEKLGGNERFVYKMFCGRIDRFFESYEAKCKKNSENVKARYATNEYDRIQSNTTEYESVPNLPSKSKSKSKSEYNPNPNPNPNPSETGETRTFVPPTIEEVVEYAVSKGKDFDEHDAEMFIGYYESKGWKVGKEKMQSWHGALSGWIARDEKRRNPF